MVSLKQAEMECEEYMVKDELAKAVINVLGKASNEDYFKKRILPGTSPVLEMILGNNLELEEK